MKAFVALQEVQPSLLRPSHKFLSKLKSNCKLHRLSLISTLGIALIAGAQFDDHLNAQALTTEQAAPAQSLVNSSGVVTHLTYTDSLYYSAWPTILNRLEVLGVKHVRDGYGYWPQGSVFFSRHQQLANAGITTDYVVPWDTTITAQDLEQFVGQVQDMEALESPNECDAAPNCGGGSFAGLFNTVMMLPMLQNAAKNLNVPLLGPSYAYPESYSYTGDIGWLVGGNSMHIYFGGRNPGSPGWGDFDAQGNSYGSLSYWYDQSQIDVPAKPPTITESGYISFPTTSTPYTIPENVETAYTQRTLLLAYKHGYQGTFIYELVDDPSSPAGYGLLRSDLSEKPAFIGMSNMLKLLADNGASFTPGSLAYMISGGDSNLNHLLLQKSDGSYWLVLWLEKPSWDTVNSVPLTVTPENIGIETGSGYKTATNYQFNSSGGYVAFNQPMNNGWASLTVTDQISVIKIVAK